MQTWLTGWRVLVLAVLLGLLTVVVSIGVLHVLADHARVHLVDTYLGTLIQRGTLPAVDTLTPPASPRNRVPAAGTAPGEGPGQPASPAGSTPGSTAHPPLLD